MKATAALAAMLLCSACADSGDAADAPAATPPQATAKVFGNAPPRPLAAAAPQPAAPSGGFELRLSRGACYGRCPAYRLSIHADGAVEFLGAASTASGIQHGQADPQLLARLRLQLSDPAFPLWGNYTRGQPSCGLWATDMPGVSIEAYVDGRWHHIQHDLGCRDAPAGLRRLEQDIDAAAGSGQWTGTGAAR